MNSDMSDVDVSHDIDHALKINGDRIERLEKSIEDAMPRFQEWMDYHPDPSSYESAVYFLRMGEEAAAVSRNRDELIRASQERYELMKRKYCLPDVRREWRSFVKFRNACVVMAVVAVVAIFLAYVIAVVTSVDYNHRVTGAEEYDGGGGAVTNALISHIMTRTPMGYATRNASSEYHTGSWSSTKDSM